LLDLHPECRYRLADFDVFMPLPPICPRFSSFQPPSIAVDRRKAISNEIAACLLDQYGGFIKANGWIAALCPYGHHRDSPGAHFGFNPQTGNGFCFGRHGCLSLALMCALLNVTTPSMA
jgi:hypothetical protein